MRAKLSLIERGERLKQLLRGGIEEHTSLRPYTRLGVGGVADYFTRVETSEALIEAVAGAIFVDLPFRVIGQGSRIIISETGFPGLIIENRTAEIRLSAAEGLVVLSSGVKLVTLANRLAAEGLSGFEWAARAAGSVGGALAHAQPGLSARLREVVVVRARKPRFQRSSPREMVELLVLPRERWLESLAQRPILVTARLQAGHRRLETVLQAMAERQLSQKLPATTIAPVFHDPPGQRASELLRRAGCLGRREGGAELTRLEPNTLVNRGQATAEEVRRLIDTSKERVMAEFGVLLEEAVEYLGHW